MASGIRYSCYESTIRNQTQCRHGHEILDGRLESLTERRLLIAQELNERLHQEKGTRDGHSSRSYCRTSLQFRIHVQIS